MMRTLIALFLIATLQTSPAAAETLAFVDVSVVPMSSETVIGNQTVVISDGTIVKLGDASDVTPPSGAVLIDGRGLFLMPGLAEMHAHVPSIRNEAALSRMLFLNVANGVTTIRGMLGAPNQLKLREQLESGERLGPRLFTSGPSLNGNSVSGPVDASRQIEEQQAAGYDFAKLHPGLTLAEFEALDAKADELGFTYAGHVSVNVGVERALAAGQASIDHLDGYIQALVPPDTDYPDSANQLFGIALAPLADEGNIPALAQATADAGVWIVPTQILLEHWTLPPSAVEMAMRPEMRFMPVSDVRNWTQSKDSILNNENYDLESIEQYHRIRRQLIKALADADAGLLLGSDAPQIFNVPGFATRQELELLVDAGLTPYQALKTGTVNPAQFFGIEESAGMVAEGFDADLVLVEGNPLEDIRNTGKIRGVVVRGRWVDEAEIQAGLAALAR